MRNGMILYHSLSGCGAVGSALDWGSRGREFKSRHSDQNLGISMDSEVFFIFRQISRPLDSFVKFKESRGLIFYENYNELFRKYSRCF